MLKNILGLDITNVHFDSKKIQVNGLFVPLKGTKSDGHNYIEDAVSNGAIATLWNKDKEVPKHLETKIKFILVEDTLTYFQELAALYRKEINPIVIGVTGSNGKTTVKEFLSVVLKEKYKVHKNTGNFNNHIGVPLTLLSMPMDTEVCVIEMGMNHLGEIRTLSNTATPNIAIICNIGESHIGLLGSREKIAEAKLEILEGLTDKNAIFFDGDEPLLNHLTGTDISKKHIFNIEQKDQKISFEFNNETYSISTFGQHNAKNALFAIKVAKSLGVDDVLIKNALMKFQNQSLRLEYKEINNNSFLLDCYNASLTSMKSSLDTFLSIKTDKTKVAILGDIFELGNESESIHKQIGEIIFSINSNKMEFWLIGENMRNAFKINQDKENVYHFSDKEELYSLIRANKGLIQDHYFLLKGSRGMKLEDVYNHFLLSDNIAD